MSEQTNDQQVRDEFERALGDIAGSSPCAIYLASAGSADSLGNAINSHFGGRAKAFYDALVQIAKSSCNGAGSDPQ
jgi:hypothetical protein